MRLFILLSLLFGLITSSMAHHVLGRPSYGLNEDSNTPPSMQVETRIGKYFVTYMVYPAFPRPNVVGRINLYATTIDDNKTFDGEVTFEISDDSYFYSNSETIGVQTIDENVYRQRFVVKEAGNYIITAKFIADKEPYIIDFPLRIGAPAKLTLPIIIIGFIVVILLIINITQRRKIQQIRIRDTNKDK